MPEYKGINQKAYCVKNSIYGVFSGPHFQFPGFAHPHNLFEYFQNKAIDSNNTFWKRQNTKGSIKKHCVKKSKYGIFSGPHFPVFRLSTGKYGPEKTPYLDSFHAVTTISQQRKQKILFLAPQKERRYR